jgi:MFS transporter, UMF1 family
MKQGYKEMLLVIKELRGQKNLLYFLLSFFFYSAGVQTIIYLATVFAEKELNFESSELIMTVILLQIVAIGGAFLFAKVSSNLGNKKALIMMISIWIGICVSAYFVYSKAIFFVITFFVGLVLGGIQSSSRASYSKLLQKNESDLNSYFSLYDLLFYLSVIFGTFSFGFVDNLTNNLRYSVLILALFFIISLFLIRNVTIESEN